MRPKKIGGVDSFRAGNDANFSYREAPICSGESAWTPFYL
jgi:hypothetical protein